MVVSFLCMYPWPDGAECERVEFALWDGYGEFESAAEAHEFVLWLLDGPQPAEVLDEHGETWEFARATVRGVWTREM